MPSGIQIKNDAGTIQIDERFANLALIDKGTVWVAGAATVTVPGTTPLLAIVPQDNSGGQLSVARGRNNGNGTWTFHLFNSWHGLVVEYFVFDRPPSLGAGVGVQVFDASGDVTFDSRLKYMRVEDLIIDFNYPSSWSRTFTAGRRYAVVNTLWNIYGESGEWTDDEIPGIPQYYYWFQTYHYGVEWQSGHELAATWRPYQGGGGGPNPSPTSGLPSGLYGPNGKMIIDVTNY